MAATQCTGGGHPEFAGSAVDLFALHRRAAAGLRRPGIDAEAKGRTVRAVRALAKGTATVSPLRSGSHPCRNGTTDHTKGTLLASDAMARRRNCLGHHSRYSNRCI